MIPQFYPIGWSKDGKFACIIFTKDATNTGNIRNRFIIMDVSTDSTLYFDPLSVMNTGLEHIDSIWTNNYSKYAEQLNAHQIVQFNYSKCAQFPITGQSQREPTVWLNSYTELKDTIVNELNDTVPNIMNSYDIVLELNSFTTDPVIPIQKSKIIKRSTHHPNFTFNFEVSGYLKNPYEEQIVVIVLYDKHPGCPGAGELVIELIGAHLKTGFKK